MTAVVRESHVGLEAVQGAQHAMNTDARSY